MNLMISRFVTLLFVVFLTLGFQCGSNDSEIKRLLDLPMKEQEHTFKNFSLAKQVDVYLEAMYVEPPQTRYASYLASNGKEVLPVLINKLQETKSDTAKAYIIYAFKVIHEDYYSLSNEIKVLESLKESVTGFKEDYRKQEAEEYLRDILEKPGFPSEPRRNSISSPGTIESSRNTRSINPFLNLFLKPPLVIVFHPN